jgi:hypothetical protein
MTPVEYRNHLLETQSKEQREQAERETNTNIDI